jgi:hypothetical protein
VVVGLALALAAVALPAASPMAHPPERLQRPWPTFSVFRPLHPNRNRVAPEYHPSSVTMVVQL